MEKKLKIIEPEITCFLHHTHLLVPIKEQKYYYNWLYSNYIQLMLDKECIYKQNKGEHLLDFYNLDFSYGIVNLCPLIDYQIYNSALVKHNLRSLDFFFRDCINASYYINLYLDDFYIHTRPHYQLEHFVHDHLLYGYTENSFLTYGYNINKHLGCSEISIMELTSSFTGNDNYPINLFKAKNDSVYAIDITNIINSINDYLNSRNTTDGIKAYYLKKNSMVFGQSIYQYLNQYYNYVGTNKIIIDLRIISVLFDHKNCMLSRCVFLNEKSKIIDESLIIQFQEIVKLSEMIRNMQIKYNFIMDNAIIDKIQISLNEMMHKEYDALSKLLKKLETGWF